MGLAMQMGESKMGHVHGADLTRCRDAPCDPKVMHSKAEDIRCRTKNLFTCLGNMGPLQAHLVMDLQMHT